MLAVVLLRVHTYMVYFYCHGHKFVRDIALHPAPCSIPFSNDLEFQIQY